MMTEEEAKTKWCPHVRIGDYERGAAVNRPNEIFKCFASECMAWRWSEGTSHLLKVNLIEDVPEEVLSGYCGLAGEP